MTAVCPLCGSDKKMKRPKQLYGHAVCRGCASSFCNRRQIAFLIDIVGMNVLSMFLAVAWLIAAAALDPETPPDEVSTWPVTVALLAMFLAKDGLGGRSPGKMLTGVQVLRTRTGELCGPLASIGRNLILLLPLAPIVLAMQMYKGPRAGDRQAGTKVIWRRYQHHPIFATGASLHAGHPEGSGPAPAESLGQGGPPDTSNPFRSPRS